MAVRHPNGIPVCPPPTLQGNPLTRAVWRGRVPISLQSVDLTADVTEVAGRVPGSRPARRPQASRTASPILRVLRETIVHFVCRLGPFHPAPPP